ncbi:hypothetical protein [Streptomyces sp. TLI_146]|uniref:hypothetical protein n=1 Tax=Streptomyces sp. TLI_146 TaxID=1938858 RepID=UPI000C70BA97|nr:hypothetical protein [Streptomyces sp. TLI_146]PKV83011.1 hypothetical protein BX283_0500 [Streptomyces sp. TLI_146]
MQITEDTIKRAWRQIAAGSDLLDDAMLPPIGTAPGPYAQHAASVSGLFLVLEKDGTVRGYHGHREVFATQDLDQVLYMVAEEAVGHLAEHIAARSPGRGPVTNLVTGQAQLLEQINPAWAQRFRGGRLDDTPPAPPCGRDPLERLAWIADSWRDQDPYTNLVFFRGVGISAEQIALLHGADSAHTAAGICLADLRSMDGSGRDYWEVAWQTFCFGQAGDWVFLMYHELPPGVRVDSAALSRLGVTETVCLSATAAKGIYTFDYTRDGRRVDDGWGVLELIWYRRGRAPYYRGGELDFLNQAIRRAELEHPELVSEFELYFHALDDALGLRLPRQDIQDGTVRAAQWAHDAPGHD